MAEAGCPVRFPRFISREAKFSGRPDIGMPERAAPY